MMVGGGGGVNCRSRFTTSHALHLLSLVIPVVYSSSAHSGHTPLGVVYDMIWSHSEFFEILFSSCNQALKGGSLYAIKHITRVVCEVVCII